MRILFFILLFTSSVCFGQDKNERHILQLLARQTESWNRGDLVGFMQTYWHSDSLMFIGKNGIKWGWRRH